MKSWRMTKSPVSGEEFVRGYQKNRTKMVEVDFYRRVCITNAEKNRPVAIKMLREGKTALEIFTVTGMSMSTIYKLKKELGLTNKKGGVK
jgi:uncharacterized protein YerC